MRRAAPLCASFFAISASILLAADLRAQASSAALELRVLSAVDDRPLSGAQVLVEGISIRGITDRNGILRVPTLPAGPRKITVRYLGYAPMDEVVSLVPGRPTRLLVRMGIEPIALAPVEVRSRRSILATRGFYDRQRFGQGTFITRDEIVQDNPRYMSDVLRRTSGIQVGSSTFGGRPPASIRGSAGRCPIQYFVDGALTYNFNIDEVMPGDVEGLEIYRGAATIPAGYNKGTAACGVILIWTRVE
jgi:outer membrane receptor protein involved in Fe transport